MEIWRVKVGYGDALRNMRDALFSLERDGIDRRPGTEDLGIRPRGGYLDERIFLVKFSAENCGHFYLII
jgi:hypothetical protein